MGISDFFFARVNDDGTFGEPFQAKNIELNLETQRVGEPIPKFMLWDGGELQFSIDDPYKFMKEFAWTMLNLKRCKKHLISKNIRGYNNGTIQLHDRS